MEGLFEQVAPDMSVIVLEPSGSFSVGEIVPFMAAVANGVIYTFVVWPDCGCTLCEDNN